MMNDIRFALRTIRKHPGYAAVVVGTLAIALGAVTALFSVADATLIGPLPLVGGDRVMHVYDRQPQYDPPANASWPEVVDWRANARQLSALTVEKTESMAYAPQGEPERIIGAYVSEDYFRVFALRAALGRTFTPEEHAKNGPAVVVLGDGFWRRAFGADRGIVGRKIQLDGTAYDVVGVLAPNGAETLRGRRDVLIPFEPRRANDSRGEHFLPVFGRLADGATIESARAELDALGPKLDTDDSGHRIGIRSLREALYGKARLGLLVLLGGALFVLIIAAANVTSIMLARMNARAQELSVRAALGASRGRMVRQLLTESLILSIVGGALGLTLALWEKDLFIALWPAGAARPAAVPLDWRTLAFALGFAIVVGGVIGIVPALRGARTDLASALRGGAVPRMGWLRSALVVVQHAVAIIVLVCAGLVGQSVVKLLATPPGFDPTGVALMNVQLPEGNYPDFARRRAFHEAVIDRLRSLPGVTSASVVSNMPFGNSQTSGSFEIEGRPQPPANIRPHTSKLIADGDFFKTMRIPVVVGRTFTPADRNLTMIVSKTFADRFFPGESPIGHRIDSWGGFAEVVGVVGDVRLRQLDDAAEPQIYMNLAQAMPWATFVVRTDGDPSKLFGAMKAQVYAVDPHQPVYAVSTLDSTIAESAAQRRILATVGAAFAAVALLLAALGIYGVLSYSVSQRTREIGVRMALGAGTATVLGLVVTQGLRLAGLGAAIGVVGALLLGQLLGAFLYRMSATDPVTIVAMVALLGIVGAAACLIPARRAARVDPMTALRYE
jgi:putative ABC transport system permease protein